MIFSQYLKNFAQIMQECQELKNADILNINSNNFISYLAGKISYFSIFTALASVNPTCR